jgi:hypothetical protein
MVRDANGEKELAETLRSALHDPDDEDLALAEPN